MEDTDLARLETASRALEAYNLQPVQINFLQHSENLTWRVETRSETYLLRLHRPGASRQEIQSEMLWLNALRRKELPVPTPVAAKTGEFVSRVEDVNVTLLTWQEGVELTREQESEETAAQTGSLVGRLHAHASQWKLPAGFSRPSRDMFSFQQALDTLKPAVEDGRIAWQDLKILENTLEQLAEAASRLRKGRKIWGLLHGDLHRGNLLIHQGQIRLIDFSMCAFGYFTFDLGTCLSNVRDSFHPLFLQAYTQFFPLPPDFARLTEGFFLASYIATFARSIADPGVQETLVRRIPLIAREYAARFNRGEHFWFK